jgi:hypothetical protein
LQPSPCQLLIEELRRKRRKRPLEVSLNASDQALGLAGAKRIDDRLMFFDKPPRMGIRRADAAKDDARLTAQRLEEA